MKRTIKALHSTVRDDIADLITRRALPTPRLDHLDPFLFLNHHGPQVYPPANHGLPFGPHPHRGFETVTFILDGDIAHKDTGGHESIIKGGGVQWMTAGRGLVHSEVSSQEFMRSGGKLEILQLWLNLPSNLKMTNPAYVGRQENQIPVHEMDHGRVAIQVLAGSIEGRQGAFQPLIDIRLLTIHFKVKGHISFAVPLDHNVFFYVVRGRLMVNGSSAKHFHLLEFNHDGEDIEMEALSEATIIFGHARPFHEPIVSHGPFVMNSKQEIIQAIRDFQSGVLA